MGDRLGHLRAAAEQLDEILSEPEMSSVWETEPLIVEDQPRFLNMVFSGGWDGSPEDLLRQLWIIEDAEGRNRSGVRPKGPRPLDLDIILFGDRVIRTGMLTVPHPGVRDRAFVLVPLRELDPELRDPGDGVLYASLIDSIENQGIICYRNREPEGRLL